MSVLDAHFKQDCLPTNLVVSTMSVTFALRGSFDPTNEELDLQSLAETIPLSTSGVCCTDYKGLIRAAEGRPEKKPRKRKTHNFYNSMTMEVAVCAALSPTGPPVRTMHVKLFKNGSVQGAGCKTTQDGDYAIQALRRALDCAISRAKMWKLEVYRPLEVYNLKINLINVNFRLSHGINRDALYRLLVSLGETATYERCKHAGVGIKYLPCGKDKPISIFVFESGSVVITGSKNDDHILKGYEFITGLISSHRNKVFKLPSDALLQRFGGVSPLQEVA